MLAARPPAHFPSAAAGQGLCQLGPLSQPQDGLTCLAVRAASLCCKVQHVRVAATEGAGPVLIPISSLGPALQTSVGGKQRRGEGFQPGSHTTSRQRSGRPAFWSSCPQGWLTYTLLQRHSPKSCGQLGTWPARPARPLLGPWSQLS